MKKTLVTLLARAVESLGASPHPSIEIEIPREESFGDLSTPVAMALSKTLRRSPRSIAEDIVRSFPDAGVFGKVEIAGPGFINVTFSGEYLHESLRRLLREGKAFLRDNVGQGKTVLVEYVSANPTGPLHIGHARGAAVGNALCNLLGEMGYRVVREYYLNDAGRQIRLLGKSIHAKYQQLFGKDMGFPDEGYRGQYVDEEASALREHVAERYLGLPFEACEKEVSAWAYGRMVALIQRDLASFRIGDFTSWVSERGLYEQGDVDKAIEELRRRGFIFEKDGARWFRSSAFGDDKDRVVIKSDGEHTYFASDIAYHKNKLDREFDRIINIWGADHHGYIPRVESVMRAFGYDISHFRVILVQMVNLLKHGKPFQMSKRAGTFVTLSEVIDLVGADITKFIFLTRKSDSHLDFDIDVVTKTSAENPVFYVQYAHARINSIFSNARERAIDVPMDGPIDLLPLSTDQELRLIRKLLTYPMVLEGAATSLEPHRITFFLHELARLFHTYYHTCRILTDDIPVTRARLALCKAIEIVLQDALGILGVTTPETM